MQGTGTNYSLSFILFLFKSQVRKIKNYRQIILSMQSKYCQIRSEMYHKNIQLNTIYFLMSIKFQAVFLVVII